MRKFKLILFAAVLTLSFQFSDTYSNFSTPKAVILTFFQAGSEMDVDLLSLCFSEQAPGEWDDFRNKDLSTDHLEEIKDFVEDAEITNFEMKSDTEAIVFVAFKSRDEQIMTIKENGRWFILDF